MTEPKPVRFPFLAKTPEAMMLTGDELPPEEPSCGVREVHPSHLNGEFAVYETHSGEYEVMRNGQLWGQPFKTGDLDLAIQVCDRWATAFGQDVDHPDYREDWRP